MVSQLSRDSPFRPAHPDLNREGARLCRSQRVSALPAPSHAASTAIRPATTASAAHARSLMGRGFYGFRRRTSGRPNCCRRQTGPDSPRRLPDGSGTSSTPFDSRRSPHDREAVTRRLRRLTMAALTRSCPSIFRMRVEMACVAGLVAAMRSDKSRLRCIMPFLPAGQLRRSSP